MNKVLFELIENEMMSREVKHYDLTDKLEYGVNAHEFLVAVQRNYGFLHYSFFEDAIINKYHMDVKGLGKYMKYFNAKQFMGTKKFSERVAI